MESEGRQDDLLHNTDWQTLDMFAVDQVVVDRISKPIEEFFGSHTKQEISQGAAQRRISVCPLSTMQDLHNDNQLETRDFWTKVKHPELNSEIAYPQSYLKSSEIDFKIRFRAPLIGEHNSEVYSGLGLSVAQQMKLSQAGVI
jgi:formyl-CoA transferase